MPGETVRKEPQRWSPAMMFLQQNCRANQWSCGYKGEDSEARLKLCIPCKFHAAFFLRK